jgi:hypothetical protein
LGLKYIKKYKLVVEAVAEDGATPIEGICEFSKIEPEYEDGSIVDINVTPNIIYTDGEERYEFLGWMDEENSTPLLAASNTTEIKRTVKMDKNINLKARFNVIAKPNILEYLYNQINNLSADTSGKIYYQTKDIDLTENNKVWTGIGTSLANSFKGTYVGGGHAVNVKFSAKRDTNGEIITDKSVGIFSYTCGAVIKDLNVYVNGNDETGSSIKYCAGVVGECDAGIATSVNRFINITVNGHIGNVLEGGLGDDPPQFIGGICGKVASSTKTAKSLTYFINCKNYADIFANSSKPANSKIGGITSYVTAHATKMSAACSFVNCENHGDIWTKATEANLVTNSGGIGGILGFSGQEVIDSAYIIFKDCKSTGKIHLNDEIVNGQPTNLSVANLAIGTIAGRLSNITNSDIGNNYVRKDLRLTRSCPSYLKAPNKPNRNIIGYYDKNDENCIKHELLKLVSGVACINTDYTDNVPKVLMPD